VNLAYIILIYMRGHIEGRFEPLFLFLISPVQ
jgi:hypothetical protein